MIVYYASLNNISINTPIRPYGTSDFFKKAFDFTKALLSTHPTRDATIAEFSYFLKQENIESEDPLTDLAVFAREVLAEQVRESTFPDRPSRIGSVFTTLDYRQAWIFLYQYRKLDGWIYECSTESDDLFTGDMAIITHGRLTFSDMLNGAPNFCKDLEHYWSGQPPYNFPETLFNCSVRPLRPANLVYLYDQNGSFLYSSHLPIDPLTGEIMQLPCSTILKPPSEPGKTAIFRGRTWELVDSPN